jgi:hypothetical protein
MLRGQIKPWPGIGCGVWPPFMSKKQQGLENLNNKSMFAPIVHTLYEFDFSI